MAEQPALLGNVRKDAVDALAARLVEMCDGADDALFDLSQKAPESEQSLFFDAMRELRLKRDGMLRSFRAALDEDFAALLPGYAPGARPGVDEMKLEGLSLLGEDELDVSVAFQGMINRSREILATDLDHLRQRIGSVLGREIELEKLPLHPARVCEPFRLGVEQLGLPIKARLILFKLFQRTVLDFLQDVIATANQALAQGGVLPEIKSTRPRPLPSRGGRERSRDGEREKSGRGDDDEGSSGGGLPSGLAELLALARGGGMVPGGMPGGVPGAPIPLAQLAPGQIPVMIGGQAMFNGAPVQSDVPIQVIAPAELTTLLTKLQQQLAAVEGLPEPPSAVKGDVADLAREESEKPRALNQTEDDVITLVSMLFDFILDDPSLPDDIKVLVGRLQIPLLKVALMDKSFFGETTHPSRLLLNTLAKSGTGWTKETDDGLRAKIEAVVHSVLTDFVDDMGLFDRLLRDFEAFCAERDKRMVLIEQRLKDREEGAARTEVAQKLVRDNVAPRIAGKRLPPEVIAMIRDGWQRVLYMTAVREGGDSEGWKQRVKVLEVLVWCAQPLANEESRERQKGLVPRLLVSLRKGFEAVGFDMAKGELMIADVQNVLLRIGGGEEAKTVSVVAEPVAAPKDAKQALPQTDAVQVVRSSAEEVVIAASPPEPPKPVVDDRWRNMADHMAPGTWVEFSDPDFKVRAKIAARIRALDKFIFVNGRGVKVAEKTLEQLAQDLATGIAVPVNDTALFDRALETMITRLKGGEAVAR